MESSHFTARPIGHGVGKSRPTEQTLRIHEAAWSKRLLHGPVCLGGLTAAEQRALLRGHLLNQRISLLGTAHPRARNAIRPFF